MGAMSYKNEMIVALAFLLFIGAFFYKNHVVSAQGSTGSESVQILEDMKESMALKALWGDKKMSKKLEKLKVGISPSKFKWTKKGKNLSATFNTISAKELNILMKKLMNLAVEIQRLDISKLGASYTLELKCKW